QLHEYLIAPIEEAGLLAGKTRLVLVPHAELHYLPFAALVDRAGAGRFLMERYELTVTPSAAVWLALGDRGASRASSGVLALAPRPDVLPGSRRAVAAVVARARGRSGGRGRGRPRPRVPARRGGARRGDAVAGGRLGDRGPDGAVLRGPGDGGRARTGARSGPARPRGSRSHRPPPLLGGVRGGGGKGSEVNPGGEGAATRR